MANKPIDKDYLVASLKSFDEEVLSKKYSQGSGSSESADLSNYYTKTEVDTAIANAQLGGSDVDLSSYSTTTEMEEYVESKVENLASTEYVDNAVSNVEVDLTGYAKTEDIPTITNDLTDELKQSYDNAVGDSHTHENKSVLDKLSETDEGVLLFNGSKIQGGGEDAVIPYIGDNGNWYVNENDTGVPATGKDGMSAYEVAVAFNGFVGTEQEWLDSLKGADGISPIVNIGGNGNWFVDGVDTGVVAEGKNGDTPYIGSNNNWFIGETDTGILAKGKDGRSIVSIVKDNNNNIIVTFSDNTTENIGELSVDIQGDFLAENGFGNLRYYNGKFQYYDTASSAWIDTSVSPENVYIMQMIPQTMESFDGLYDVDLGRNKLRWTEPKDTIIDGQVCCLVEKVVIRRKLGSIPTNETDGDLVIEVKRSEFGSYTNIWFIDEDLTPTIDEVWYYKAFPISTTGFCNSSAINEKSILCKDYHLYGFKLDQNESDPSSMITYLSDCDNSGYKSAYMDYTTELFNYGDWGNTWFIRDLKPCMLNYDGTVAYELDKDDYTLKADGTASDIANDAFGGNAMIGFPKVYWKIVDNGDDTANIYFSNKKVDDDFVCWSHIDNDGNEIDYCYMPIYNGSNVNSVLRSISGKTPIYNQTGTTEITYALANNVGNDVIWYTEVFSDRMLVNLLLLLIGKSTDTQTVFGNGHYSGGSSASNLLVTGTLNDKGLFYGTNGTRKGVKVFGMENWWGNQWRRIAGWINNKGTQKVKMTYGQSDGSTVDGYNTDGSGYISIGCTPSGKNGGYISKMTVTKNGLIPTTASGSATTYYTDGLWFDNSQVYYAFVGGCSHPGLLVGTLSSRLSAEVSFNFWYVGAAVSCKPLKTT